MVELFAFKPKYHLVIFLSFIVGTAEAWETKSVLQHSNLAFVPETYFSTTNSRLCGWILLTIVPQVLCSNDSNFNVSFDNVIHVSSLIRGLIIMASTWAFSARSFALNSGSHMNEFVVSTDPDTGAFELRCKTFLPFLSLVICPS
jgi:hypothetical protein